MRLATTSRITREYAGRAKRLPDFRSVPHASSRADASTPIAAGSNAASSGRINFRISTILSPLLPSRGHYRRRNDLQDGSAQARSGSVIPQSSLAAALLEESKSLRRLQSSSTRRALA